jgi:hypothetical protein
VVYRLSTGRTVRRSNPGEGEIFYIRPDRPWGPPSLLYNGYRVLPGVKRLRRGIDHPPHLAPRLKKEDSFTYTSPLGLRGLFYGELYLYFTLFCSLLYYYCLWLMLLLCVLKKGSKASTVSGRVSMPVQILTKTREMPSENQPCQQTLLLPPHDGLWAMLWVTAANGRGVKASVRCLKMETLD